MVEKLEEEIEDVVIGEDGILTPESEVIKEAEKSFEDMTEEERDAHIESMARLLKDRSDASEADAIKLRAEIDEKKAELENLKKSLLLSANNEETQKKIDMHETMIKSSEYLLKYVLEAGIFNYDTITKDSNDIIRRVSEVLIGKKRLHSKQVNEIVNIMNGKRPAEDFNKLIERIKDVYVQKLQVFYNMRSKTSKSFIEALRLLDEKLSLITTEYFAIFENLDIGRLLYMLRAVLVIFMQCMIEEHLARGGNKFKAKSDKLDECKVVAERFFIIMQAHALSAERIKFVSNIIDFIFVAKGYENPSTVSADTVITNGGFKLTENESLIKLQLLVEKEDKDLILTEEYKKALKDSVNGTSTEESKTVEEELTKTALEFNDKIREELKTGEFEEIN